MLVVYGVTSCIVVENLRFLPSIRKRKAEVFKSLHSGDGFLKTAFLVPENAVCVEKEGYNREKNPHQLSTTTGTPKFKSDNRCRVTKI